VVAGREKEKRSSLSATLTHIWAGSGMREVMMPTQSSRRGRTQPELIASERSLLARDKRLSLLVMLCFYQLADPLLS